MRALTRTVAPSGLPVTLAEAKAHLRVTITAEDADITLKLAQAVELAEELSGRAGLEATYVLTLDTFPAYGAPVVLPVGPVVAVDSVTYRDANGSTQTVAGSVYRVGLPTGQILTRPSASWPVPEETPDAVSITFRAGYANAGAVPSRYKAAILLILADLYENRGDGAGADRGIPPAALALLSGMRSRIEG